MNIFYKKLEKYNLHIREEIEKEEKERLSKYATLSINSRGRKYRDRPCDVRTIFMRDRDRIIHSEYFRRLKHKTQVFLAPTNDVFRTRLTHTLEVAQISRTIARALKLNEDLTEAIALGHDLGHTPFGHAGEHVLDKLSPSGFNHAQQSLRVVEKLEKPGGLNLSFEVKDGIVKHSKGERKLLPYDEPDCPLTLEGEIVRVCDSIAYINHDIDDAIKCGVITLNELPPEAIKILGERHSQRISLMVYDIIANSMNKPHIYMSNEILNATETLRKYLFAEVYPRKEIDGLAESAAEILEKLYNYFIENPEIPLNTMKEVEDEDESIERIVIDFIARLTDFEAIQLFKQIFNIKELPPQLKKVEERIIF